MSSALERFSILCSNTVSAVLDIVRAFVWEEEGERGAEQPTDVVKRARTGGAEERLQFGEGELNGIEVWTVGRQKAEACAGVLDGGANLGLLVHREVIEDDDIAAPERGDEDLFHIRLERDAIDRAVEHGRGGQRRRPERGDHRVRLPVTARRVIRRARPSRAPRIAAQEVGGDARLVDKHEVAGVVKRQRRRPASSRGGDVSAALFAGVYRFF